MIDLKPAVLQALAALPACTAAAFSREEVPLPVITVNQEDASVFAQADGAPYLEEYILSVCVHAATQEETERLALSADQALKQMGLRLTGARDLYNEEAYAWEKTLRYRALLHQNTIYQ